MPSYSKQGSKFVPPPPPHNGFCRIIFFCTPSTVEKNLEGSISTKSLPSCAILDPQNMTVSLVKNNTINCTLLELIIFLFYRNFLQSPDIPCKHYKWRSRPSVQRLFDHDFEPFLTSPASVDFFAVIEIFDDHEPLLTRLQHR